MDLDNCVLHFTVCQCQKHWSVAILGSYCAIILALLGLTLLCLLFTVKADIEVSYENGSHKAIILVCNPHRLLNHSKFKLVKNVIKLKINSEEKTLHERDASFGENFEIDVNLPPQVCEQNGELFVETVYGDKPTEKSEAHHIAKLPCYGKYYKV